MSIVDPLKFITTALAPVVALSACAILASNAQTQFSAVVDRLRALNVERRGYLAAPELTPAEALRLKSLEHQIPVFFRRSRHLRNAMFLLFLGMMCILMTSFMVISSATFPWELLANASKWCFFGGLFFVFSGILCLLREVHLTFRVVRYELGHFDRQAARDLGRGFKSYCGTMSIPDPTEAARELVAHQARAPLFEAMRDYALLEKLVFHTPGHKQGRGSDPAFRGLVGAATLRMDLTELDELDELHHPEGVIKEAQVLAAEAFGADRTFFLVNGSTTGIHAMIVAVCDPGDKLIIPRDAHQSVAGGLILSGARSVYMRPVWDDELCIAHGVTPAMVEEALIAHPDAKGVLVVHPTCFGGGSDLERIAELCHAHGKPLLVDEALGPHLHFHPALPASGMQAGADMVVQSTHKTLSGLTQASMLHVRDGLVNVNRVRNVLQLVQSSSPNYMLMASLDTARRQMATSGMRLLTDTIALADDARRRLNEVPGVHVFGPEKCRPEGLFALDTTKLTINVVGLGLTGFQALRLLNERFDIQPDMATLHNVLLIVTIGNSQRDMDRVVEAFTALSAQAAASDSLGRSAVPTGLPVPAQLPIARMTPREAFFAPTEAIALEASEGRVCAEFVAPYPPGIPILAPGELITADLIDDMQIVHEMGGFIRGPEDVRLRTIKVVTSRVS